MCGEIDVGDTPPPGRACWVWREQGQPRWKRWVRGDRRALGRFQKPPRNPLAGRSLKSLEKCPNPWAEGTPEFWLEEVARSARGQRARASGGLRSWGQAWSLEGRTDSVGVTDPTFTQVPQLSFQDSPASPEMTHPPPLQSSQEHPFLCAKSPPGPCMHGSPPLCQAGLCFCGGVGVSQ